MLAPISTFRALRRFSSKGEVMLATKLRTDRNQLGRMRFGWDELLLVRSFPPNYAFFDPAPRTSGSASVVPGRKSIIRWERTDEQEFVPTESHSPQLISISS